MTEFKKGDRVVFVKGDRYRSIEMPKGTRGTYDGDDPINVAPFVLLDSGERVLAWRDSIAHAEDHGTGDGSASDICAEPGCNCDLERRFPAPLDPAKVAITIKGGDYIEAESDGTKIGGKVSHVTERGFVSIEHLGEFAIHHITPSPLPKGYRMFVLTAHTPAPEPEPEWKPGTVYAAASADGPVRLYRNKGIDRDYWLDAGGEMVPDEAVSKVRPLVVLDPESDTDRLWNIIREVDGNHDLGAGALAEAILERLSR